MTYFTNCIELKTEGIVMSPLTVISDEQESHFFAEIKTVRRLINQFFGFRKVRTPSGLVDFNFIKNICFILVIRWRKKLTLFSQLREMILHVDRASITHTSKIKLWSYLLKNLIVYPL